MDFFRWSVFIQFDKFGIRLGRFHGWKREHFHATRCPKNRFRQRLHWRIRAGYVEDQLETYAQRRSAMGSLPAVFLDGPSKLLFHARRFQPGSSQYGVPE